MRQHKFSAHEVAAVIAGHAASQDDEEDEKNPEPGIWQTDDNDLPQVPWAQKRRFRTKRGAHNKLLLEVEEGDTFKRIVPQEEQDDYLRQMLLKEDSDVPLARDSGYHILQQRTMGISRRAWAAFLGKQSVLQRTQNIPPERRKGGIKVTVRGHLEMDLIEGKQKDVNKTFLTDDWYWLSVVDVLTGFFIVRKNSDPRKGKPKSAETTTRSLREVLNAMQAKLGKPILSISSDKGGEFRASTGRMLKERGIKQKFVDRASRVEHCNQIFQRNFYRLYKLRRGTFKSLQKQAEHLVNQTFNKYTRMTPNEAVLAEDRYLAPRYNNARQQPEEQYKARVIGQGDRVRHLVNIRKRVRNLAYKAYRGTHWSASIRHVASKKRVGPAFKYLVGGSWYDRDALLYVGPESDAVTDAHVAARKGDQDGQHALWH